MGVHDEETAQAADSQQQPLNRAEFNAANEKLLEDQLQVSEDKVVDYVPGKN
ncbi:hypothetical protein ACHHV8_34325 [Paenibacillus sp. TAB 01]|uniref:hypothetical protein n=1 Tax=Paenibacillus sp. TAB 01 TaxID=3368988 RepID=UPI0037523A8C